MHIKNSQKLYGVVEKKNLFDTIRVFRRGYLIDKPELICISGDGKYSSAVEAVSVERLKDRNELLRNPEMYLKRIEALRKRISKNGINAQLDRLEKLENEFNKEVLLQSQR